MNELNESFQAGKLSISVAQENPAALVMFQGTSDARDPSTLLDPYLSRLAEKLRDRTLVLDFQKLLFMNSSSVSPILQFMKRLDQNNARVSLRYNLEVGWQKVHRQCMLSICKTLKNVRVEDA